MARIDKVYVHRDLWNEVISCEEAGTDEVLFGRHAVVLDLNDTRGQHSQVARNSHRNVARATQQSEEVRMTRKMKYKKSQTVYFTK